MRFVLTVSYGVNEMRMSNYNNNINSEHQEALSSFHVSLYFSPIAWFHSLCGCAYMPVYWMPVRMIFCIEFSRICMLIHKRHSNFVVSNTNISINTTKNTTTFYSVFVCALTLTHRHSNTIIHPHIHTRIKHIHSIFKCYEYSFDLLYVGKKSYNKIDLSLHWNGVRKFRW